MSSLPAIEVMRFGGPEVLELCELPDRVLRAGQARVEVSVVALFLDTALRRGEGRDWFELTSPYVPGSGVAGRMSAVGAGVDTDWVGRTVVTDTGRAAFAITAPGGEFSAHGMTSGDFARIDRDAARERGIAARGIGQRSSRPRRASGSSSARLTRRRRARCGRSSARRSRSSRQRRRTRGSRAAT